MANSFNYIPISAAKASDFTHKCSPIQSHHNLNTFKLYPKSFGPLYYDGGSMMELQCFTYIYIHELCSMILSLKHSGCLTPVYIRQEKMLQCKDASASSSR